MPHDCRICWARLAFRDLHNVKPCELSCLSSRASSFIPKACLTDMRCSSSEYYLNIKIDKKCNIFCGNHRVLQLEFSCTMPGCTLYLSRSISRDSELPTISATGEVSRTYLHSFSSCSPVALLSILQVTAIF